MSVKVYLWLPLIFLLACVQNNEQGQEAKTNVFNEADVYEKLEKLGVQLNKPNIPIANYTNAVTVGNLVFLAGKGCRDDEGKVIVGKLGDNMSIEEGYSAARKIGISQLEVLHEHLGDLNRVKQIVKVTGMVNATSDFTQHPEVINGFSDFMVEVFGESGKHARAAVGMGSLPRGLALEIDMIVEIY